MPERTLGVVTMFPLLRILGMVVVVEEVVEETQRAVEEEAK